MSNCRWVASDQPRAVKGRHVESCEGAPCPGCQPCTEPHCLVQWYGERGDCETHAQTVCPSCVGKVREHLANVVRMSGLPLVDEVLTLGNDNTEAADLLGPVADPAQWRQRGTYGHVYHPDSRMGELHPYWVLATWDLIVTEHLDHKRTQRAGILSSATYLDANLNYLAADLEFDFVSLANEAAACAGYLERILHDDEQRDEGAPCMACEKPLRRVWGDDQSKDGWECPRCRQRSTEDQYRFAVAHLHREEATELTDRDMEIRTGVKAGTVGVWAQRGLVKRRRDSGRTLYDVADVEAVLAQKRRLVS